MGALDWLNRFADRTSNGAQKAINYFAEPITGTARATADAIVSRQMQPEIDRQNANRINTNNQLAASAEAQRRAGNGQRALKLISMQNGQTTVGQNAFGRELTSPEDARRSFTDLAGYAAMGYSAPVNALAKAGPLIRIVGQGLVRGVENAVPQAAIDLATGRDLKETAVDAARNVGTGAIINTAFSPKSVISGVREAAGFAGNKTIPAIENAVSPAVTRGAAVPERAIASSVPATPPVREKSFGVAARTSPDLSPETQALAKATDFSYAPRNTEELGQRAAAGVDAMGLDVARTKALSATDITDEATAHAIETAKRLDAAGDHSGANEIIQINAERALQAGRAAQANVLLARLSPLGAKKTLANLALENGKNLTDDQLNKAASLMESALGLPEGRERSLGIQKANEYIRQQFPSSIVDQALSVIQAGLLTGLKTTTSNASANVGSFLGKKISDVPATAVDAAIGAFTGKRTKTMTGRGIIDGLTGGAKEAYDYFRSGYDPLMDGSKYDSGTVFSNNKVGQATRAYVETVQRWIGAQDKPIKAAAFMNSVADQAGAEAKNLGLRGDQYSEYVDGMLKNPSAEIGKRAAAEAEQVVFQNDTKIGKAASNLQQLPLGKGLIPFAKTPSAVVGNVLSYTPVGAAYDIGAKALKGQADQRFVSQAVGKGLVGTGVLGAGAAISGNINTSYPTTEKERELWKAENRTDSSIVLPGGTQIQAQSLGPFGNLLVAGAAGKQAYDSGAGVGTALTGQALNTALESPALTGVSNLVDAAKDPTKKGETFAQSVAGELVPTISGDVANLLDRNQNGDVRMRETNNLADAVTNKIPVLRNTNPQAVDSLGQERITGKGAFQQLIDPTKSKDLNSTPVIDELRRLADSGNAISISKADRKQTVFGEKKTLTDDELRQYVKDSGDSFTRGASLIMQTPSYKALSDDRKKEVLDAAFSDSRGDSKLGLTGKGSVAGTSTSLGSVTKSQKDLAKAEAEQSGKNVAIDSRFGYRIDPDTGEAKFYDREKIRDSADSKRTDSLISTAKEGKDYGTVVSLSQKKLESLKKEYQALDPDLDADRIAQIEAQAINVQQDIDKYRKGGSTGKKGNKLKLSSRSASAPKAAAVGKSIRINVSSAAPKVSVKRPTIRKISVR